MPAAADIDLDAQYANRRAARIENGSLRVTVLLEGGHIAEIFDKRTSINPLWTPPWTTIDPCEYDAAAHPQFGGGPDAKLLAGIMGHNLCLDIFGGPSADEAAAGLTAHGEGSAASYDAAANGALELRAYFPIAQIAFTRRITLHDRIAAVHERVENLTGVDRPIGWTQHVTLGPPFLQKGATQFRASATRSRVYEGAFGDDDYLARGSDFDWPHGPRADGGTIDLQRFSEADASCAYTAHLMDPGRDTAFFAAFTPACRLAIGYVWRRRDFPWLGIWEENASRQHQPWDGRALTRGMEFGVSPFPERRQRMVERGCLFDTPAFRWLPARGVLEAEYCALTASADRVPETLEWPL
jgi:hypothetical protein